MDQVLNFSLSYDQLLQEANESIQKCDLREAGPYYLEELNKAREFLAFWHRLANRGCPGLEEYDRIEADWLHLNALIYTRED